MDNTPKNNASEIIYREGTIFHEIRVDKYNNEIREGFIFENIQDGEKFKAKREVMLELASKVSADKPFSYLLNNGWKGNEKMQAGAGVAIKLTPKGDFYECSFYTGELGEPFESNKITRRTHIKFDKKHLDAIFTFLLCNEKVAQQKLTISRDKRNNLLLD